MEDIFKTLGGILRPVTLYNYKCPKCGGHYVDIKQPLPYKYCQAHMGRNPNPIICGGELNLL